MADKTAYHPDGNRFITFLEEPHTYTDNMGVRYQSGTSFSKPYFTKFDMDAMSRKCAKGRNPKYADRNPEDIKAEWLAEGLRGSSEGDNTHLYAEGVYNGIAPSLLPRPISERCEKMFIQVDRAADYLFTRYDYIGSEIVIFSPDLNLAGMVDLLFFDPESRNVLILDHKQNKEITTENRFQSGFGPLSHLQETHKNKYTLQLSTYQYILAKEKYFPDATGFKRVLIHYTPTNFKFIPLHYFQHEVTEILKHEHRI